MRRIFKKQFLFSLCRNFSNSLMQPTAGLIVIGNEILNGDVLDTNTHFLAKKLYSMGIELQKVSIIPDDIDLIAKEVREFSSTFQHVFTSGGIGPTHDDRTYEGVAQAFQDKLHFHPILLEVIQNYFHMTDEEIRTAIEKLKTQIHSQTDVTSLSTSVLLDAGIDARLKLAYLPMSAHLFCKEDDETAKFPIVTVQNVFILPGVPKLFERCVRYLEKEIDHPRKAFGKKHIYVNWNETRLASLLNDMATRYSLVTIGSYPEFYNSFYKVRISLESAEKHDLEAAYQFLQSNIPDEALVYYDPHPLNNSYEKVLDFAQSRCSQEFQRKVLSSLAIIENACIKYKQEVFISFNGGKDCSVLLHLWHAVLSKIASNSTSLPKESKPERLALYIRSKQPFPEVEDFMQEAADRYHLKLVRIDGLMKPSLEQFLKERDFCKTVLMGTRRSDPRAADLKPESPTDNGWPVLMRVNPLLEWSYADVWTFMRGLCIPYCTLYDRGYTSLGSMENTHPNPHLRYVDEHGLVKFRPAYLLQDGDSTERDGRN